jgi:hypothetical protein
VLRNLGYEDFVNSLREGLKVTIVQRGGKGSFTFLCEPPPALAPNQQPRPVLGGGGVHCGWPERDDFVS